MSYKAAIANTKAYADILFGNVLDVSVWDDDGEQYDVVVKVSAEGEFSFGHYVPSSGWEDSFEVKCTGFRQEILCGLPAGISDDVRGSIYDAVWLAVHEVIVREELGDSFFESEYGV